MLIVFHIKDDQQYAAVRRTWVVDEADF